MDLAKIMKVLFKLLGFKKSLSFSKEGIDLATIIPWAIGRIRLNPRCNRKALGTGCCHPLCDLGRFYVPPLIMLFMWKLDLSPDSQGCPGHSRGCEMALTQHRSSINACLPSPHASLTESQISFLSIVLFEHASFSILSWFAEYSDISYICVALLK